MGDSGIPTVSPLAGYQDTAPELYQGQAQSSTSPITAAPPLQVGGVGLTNPESVTAALSGSGFPGLPAIAPSMLYSQEQGPQIATGGSGIPTFGAPGTAAPPPPPVVEGQLLATGQSGIPTYAGPQPKPRAPIAVGSTGIPTYYVPPSLQQQFSDGTYDPSLLSPGEGSGGPAGTGIGSPADVGFTANTNEQGIPTNLDGVPTVAPTVDLTDPSVGGTGLSAAPTGLTGAELSEAVAAEAGDTGVSDSSSGGLSGADASAAAAAEAGETGESSGDGGGAPSGGCRIANFTMDQLHLPADHQARVYWSGLSRRWLQKGQASRTDLVRHAAYMRASRDIVRELGKLTPCEQRDLAKSLAPALVDAITPDTPVEYGVAELDVIANRLADQLGVRKPRRYTALGG